MCEELSDCAVMTDGAASVFQRGVIKVKLWVPGRERGGAGAGAGRGGREQRRRKRELDQIRQMIRAISQCGKVLDNGERYFLPVHSGVKGQWGAKSVTSDPVTSEELLIRVSPLSSRVIICWTRLLPRRNESKWQTLDKVAELISK